jgi:hypothetical protein
VFLIRFDAPFFFAEEKGPDQRKDASIARTRATLQQGRSANKLLHATMFLSISSPLFLTMMFILLIVQADKASILDEAIGYLKSLQLQVQVRNEDSQNFHDITDLLDQ